MTDTYYSCGDLAPGDGQALRELLDSFRLQTDLNRDLLTAAFLTPMWGGPIGFAPQAPPEWGATGSRCGRRNQRKIVQLLPFGRDHLRAPGDVGRVSGRTTCFGRRDSRARPLKRGRNDDSLSGGRSTNGRWVRTGTSDHDGLDGANRHDRRQPGKSRRPAAPSASSPDNRVADGAVW